MLAEASVTRGAKADRATGGVTRHRLSEGLLRGRVPDRHRSVLAPDREVRAVGLKARTDGVARRRGSPTGVGLARLPERHGADPAGDRVARARVVPSGLSAMAVKTSLDSTLTPNGSPILSPVPTSNREAPWKNSDCERAPVGMNDMATTNRGAGKRLADRWWRGRIHGPRVPGLSGSSSR